MRAAGSPFKVSVQFFALLLAPEDTPPPTPPRVDDSKAGMGIMMRIKMIRVTMELTVGRREESMIN